MVTSTNQNVLTFSQLAALEPGLKALLIDCRGLQPILGRTCPLHDWYKLFKPRLVRLVGFDARVNDEILRSSRAYNLAYQKCFDALKCPKGCLCD